MNVFRALKKSSILYTTLNTWGYRKYICKIVHLDQWPCRRVINITNLQNISTDFTTTCGDLSRDWFLMHFHNLYNRLFTAVLFVIHTKRQATDTLFTCKSTMWLRHRSGGATPSVRLVLQARAGWDNGLLQASCTHCTPVHSQNGNLRKMQSK